MGKDRDCLARLNVTAQGVGRVGSVGSEMETLIAEAHHGTGGIAMLRPTAWGRGGVGRISKVVERLLATGSGSSSLLREDGPGSMGSG